MMKSQDFDSGAAIRLGEKTLDPNATRWGLLLVLFMRVVAGLWILQGLVQWQIVLTAPSDLFSTIPTPTAVAIVYFAVMDLLAAVGGLGHAGEIADLPGAGLLGRGRQAQVDEAGAGDLERTDPALHLCLSIQRGHKRLGQRPRVALERLGQLHGRGDGQVAVGGLLG
mgnify:CR=1 FL=1